MSVTLRQRLQAFTNARVALGRVGCSLPTQAVLDFQLAHARARDAVGNALPPGVFADALPGERLIEVHSRAEDRQTYLMRPDLGRRLRPEDAQLLRQERGQLAIILADGLSATAVLAHASPLARELIARAAGHWTIAPIVVAHQARVALGDEIGEALDAELVVMLIGERPGLSAADSLSAYLTWMPRVGRVDSERNCVSNIRPPHGWSIAQAADEIMRIAGRARALGRSGVAMIDGLPSPD